MTAQALRLSGKLLSSANDQGAVFEATGLANVVDDLTQEGGVSSLLTCWGQTMNWWRSMMACPAGGSRLPHAGSLMR